MYSSLLSLSLLFFHVPLWQEQSEYDCEHSMSMQHNYHFILSKFSVHFCARAVNSLIFIDQLFLVNFKSFSCFLKLFVHC